MVPRGGGGHPVVGSCAEGSNADQAERHHVSAELPRTAATESEKIARSIIKPFFCQKRSLDTVLAAPPNTLKAVQCLQSIEGPVGGMDSLSGSEELC